LFYRTFGEMRRAIAEIGRAGYQGVEFFDGNLVDCKGVMHCAAIINCSRRDHYSCRDPCQILKVNSIWREN
jgi:hypothetical protein